MAAEGPREPSAARAQKVFNVGFVYVLEPGKAPSGDLLSLHAELRDKVVEHWSHITGGRSHITTHVNRMADSPPDPHFCRDYGPCSVGEGDCDPGQCRAGLVCVDDVGPQYGLPAIYDVCEVPSGNMQGVPDPHLCRDYGPCGVGQGDCDPGQCGAGLVCVNDVGPQYGLPAIYDVCEVPSGSPAPAPDPDYCRDYGPCGVGQGDCDPGQCADGLVCAADVGPQYGLPAIYDVCEVPNG